MLVSSHLSNWAPFLDFTGFALAETHHHPSAQFGFLRVSADNGLGQVGPDIYFLFWGQITLQALRMGMERCAIG